jgi:diguanylate cyclase (GGDEF)-like protein/PAS domain S-box-containing protein
MHHEQHELPYAAVFGATPASLLLLTPDLVIRDANAAYLAAVGRSREELLGRQLFDAFPGSDASEEGGGSAVRASIERALTTRQPDTMAVQRYDIARNDGSFEKRYWSPIHVPVLDADGEVVLLLHRAEDVTEFIRKRDGDDVGQERSWRWRMQAVEQDLVARARELQQLNAELRSTHDQLVVRALHDPLTGLLIRPVILEQLTRALSRRSRRPQPVAVLFIDVDHFKQVNDRHGHAAGDELLHCVAEQLQRSLRPGDSVARFGGDEFVVLLDDLPAATDAEAVAERVLEGVRTCRLPAGMSSALSASIGVAVAEGPGHTAELLISQADRAMYEAKRGGGDRYAVHARTPDPRANRLTPDALPLAARDRPSPYRALRGMLGWILLQLVLADEVVHGRRDHVRRDRAGEPARLAPEDDVVPGGKHCDPGRHTRMMAHRRRTVHSG